MSLAPEGNGGARATGRGSRLKRGLTLALTVTILVLLYANLDRQAVLLRLRYMDLALFFLGVTFFLPQLLVTALRWMAMVSRISPTSLADSLRLILAGKALNAFVPSKLGETSKAYFLRTRSAVPLSKGVAVVLLEKVLDMAGLCTLLLAGLLLLSELGKLEIFAAAGSLAVLLVTAVILVVSARSLGWLSPRRPGFWEKLHRLLAGWDEVLDDWRRRPGLLVAIAGLSVLLWTLHLAQIYVFFLAVGAHVAPRLVAAYVPVSIFIGLLPVTIGGMGTRDSALIFLFAPWESAATMAAIGILCSLRYWLDSLFGLPFFLHYSWARESSRPAGPPPEQPDVTPALRRQD